MESVSRRPAAPAAAPLSKSARAIFAVSIFLSAFLLFQVQPMFGRFILPWFGGTPEVWTTCMLFFQLFLLAGYAYSHWLVTVLRPRTQALVHAALLVAAAALAFRVIPPESLKPSPGQSPVLLILQICALCIGLPYFVLSTTGPLLQGWLARCHGAAVPYRLYALSNAGSLLALLTFPFVFEPLLSRSRLAGFWSGGFVLFAVCCGLCALTILRRVPQPAPAQPGPHHDKSGAKPDRLARFLWLALPFAASVELLAVTNKITQDIAAIPFLWVLPLSLYLLSFVICFDHQRWYKRGFFVVLFALGIAGVIGSRRLEEQAADVRLVISLYGFMLFACCMVCHGELYRLKPPARYLTGYYLLIAAGGAAGGLFVGVLAPLIFNVYHELHLGLLAAVLFVLMADRTSALARSRRRYLWMGAIVAVGLAGILFQGKLSVDRQTALENTRNFFGVLTVWEESPEAPENHKRLLMHGTTFHGLQFIAPDKRLLPTAYYSPESGVGLLMEATREQSGRRIGIIGLGVGTIAIYGHEGDLVRFYEINPEVHRLANQYFTYLSSSPARLEYVFGDGRLSMEAETPQNYDILVLDAFSSDSVPVHLLTKEAMEIYLKHLAPDGVLAFHISTMHLDLQSVVWKLADRLGLRSLWIEGYENEERGALASDWILLSRSGAVLDNPLLQEAASQPYGGLERIDLWTDDRVNLLQVLRASPLRSAAK